MSRYSDLVTFKLPIVFDEILSLLQDDNDELSTFSRIVSEELRYRALNNKANYTMLTRLDTFLACYLLDLPREIKAATLIELMDSYTMGICFIERSIERSMVPVDKTLVKFTWIKKVPVIYTVRLNNANTTKHRTD